MFNRLLIFVYVFGLVAIACDQNTIHTTAASAGNTETATIPAMPPAFHQYWFQGKAELSTYLVDQLRYGERRQAQQVNVFVTEDFSKSKQVKLDNPEQAGADRSPILKLNAVRRFHTGIYDYALMLSVFSPIDASPTLKTTASVLDWCGMVFGQINYSSGAYRLQDFSYFESEGDRSIKLPKALLEDEIWTRLRINPSSIPAGEQIVIPSSWNARLLHKKMEAVPATIDHKNNGETSILLLQYRQGDRSLMIVYETAFPHRIKSWEEREKGELQSKGELKATRMSAYWSEHANRDLPLRDSLGLVF